MGSTMGCRSAVRWASVAGLCATTVVGLATPGEADFYNGSYTATASASLIGVGFTVQPGVLFDQLIDAGASVAQAQIDSLGTTNAFASDPYPSTSVVGLPGLGAAFGFGGVPAYPLIASSNARTPTDHKSAGSITLGASSAVGSSKGNVTDGATTAAASTTFDTTSNKVTSVADSQISSLSAGSELSLSGVHTTASMTVASDGTAKQDSSFTVSSLSILGQRVSVTGTGLSIAGNDLPLGVDPSSVLAPLLSRLASQGVTITYLPAIRTATSVTSAGLKIDGLFPVPQGVIPSVPNLPVPLPVGVGVSGLNAATSEITLGRATAAVTNSAFGDASFTGGAFTPPTTTNRSVVRPPRTAPATLRGETAPSTLGGPTVADLGVAPLGVTSTAAGSDVQATPQVARAAQAPVVQTASAVVDAIRLDKFYPVLFLAAIVGLGFLQVIRNLGVRNP
jgi:hypothetical protein